MEPVQEKIEPEPTVSVATETESVGCPQPEEWLDEYGDSLYQYALIRVRDPHTAEDLVQDTLISGVKGFEHFRGQSTVKTWLTTILRRRIADHFQSASRRRKLTCPNEDGNDVRSESESGKELDDYSFAIHHARLFHPKISNNDFRTSMEREEFWNVAQACLASLPAHYRQAFTTRLTQSESSLEEISASINVTPNNLAVRLFRARIMLRACFERKWK